MRDLLQEAIELVAEYLRDDPTLPADTGDATKVDPHALSEDAAIWLPRKHCAFSGCNHTFVSGKKLVQHLQEDPAHNQLLSTIIHHMPATIDKDDVRFFSAYSEAIAVKTRSGALLDTYSIDRRAISKYNEAVADDSVHSLICFSCAMRYTHVKSFGEKNEIQWQKVLSGDRDVSFMNMERQHCAEIYGLDKYIERYGHQPGFPDLRHRIAEFEDWQLIVPFSQRPLTILCCPEDRRCTGNAMRQCISTKTLCKDVHFFMEAETHVFGGRGSRDLPLFLFLGWCVFQLLKK